MKMPNEPIHEIKNSEEEENQRLGSHGCENNVFVQDASLHHKASRKHTKRKLGKPRGV